MKLIRKADLNIVKRIRKENVVFIDEASVYFVSPGKQRWVSPGETYERTKTKYSKKMHVWGSFSSKGVIELQTFENNFLTAKSTLKYLRSQKISSTSCIQIDTFCYATTTLHRFGMSLDYYIQNDIKLLEWPTYSPDLNPIENIWANIKNK